MSQNGQAVPDPSLAEAHSPAADSDATTTPTKDSLKEKMRAALGAAAYSSPKSPQQPAPVPAQQSPVQPSNQSFLGYGAPPYRPNYAGYPPAAMYYQPQQQYIAPTQEQWAGQPFQRPIYREYIPGMVPGYHPAQQQRYQAHMEALAQQQAAHPHTATSPSEAAAQGTPQSAPVYANTNTPPTTVTSPSAPPQNGQNAAATHVESPAATSTLAPPTSERSALVSSGETSLQPPIRHAKAAAATTPKTEASPAPEPNGVDVKPATPVAADKTPAKPEPVEPATEIKVTPAETKPMEVVAPVESVKEEKPASPAVTPVEKEPVVESSPAPTSTQPAEASAIKSPTPATTPKDAPVVKTDAEPAKQSPVKAASPAATPVAESEESSAPTPSKSPAPQLLSPVPVKAESSASSSVESTPSTSPAPTGTSPRPEAYKVTDADQKAARVNDSASAPPGVLTYSAAQLMDLMKLAKEMPPNPALMNALDKSRINSPAAKGGAKGGGAAAKGGRRGDKTAKVAAQPPIRPVADPNSIEAKARTFRGILNKITPETFDKLVKKMLEVPVESVETLIALVDIIADVAVRELKFCSMYATLCSKLAFSLPTFEMPDIGKQNFRVVILRKCQSLFEQRRPVQAVPATITDLEARQEFELKENKVRNNTLGLMKFIGELANQNVLAMSIIPRIMDSLWATNSYEDFELYTILLATSGKAMGDPAVDAIGKCRAWIKEYSNRDKERQDSEGTRIRYLMQDVIDLADNKWVPRQASAAAQGPKTLDEIREDIARKERQLEQDLLRAKAQGSRGRMAAPVPVKTPTRGPSVLQRSTDVPRTPSSPSQGGRGKSGFAASSSTTALSPGRPSGGATSPGPVLSNAYDSLLSASADNFSPNFDLEASGSSIPPEEAEEEGAMDPAALDEAIEEFLDSNEAAEAVENLAEGPAVEESCKYYVSRLLLKVIDLTADTRRQWTIKLLALFPETDGLKNTDKTLVPALVQTVAELDTIDMPKAPGFLAGMIGELYKRKTIPYNSLSKILEPLKGDVGSPRTTTIITTILAALAPADIQQLVKQSNFKIAAWNIPEDKTPEVLKVSQDTIEAMLGRGDDIFKVLLRAKEVNDRALKSADFILRAVEKIVTDFKNSPSVEVNDEQMNIIKLVCAETAHGKAIATYLVDAYPKNPKDAIPLFEAFVTAGLKHQHITDASNKHQDYLYDPAFNKWTHHKNPTPAAAAKPSSSSKPGKSLPKGAHKKKGK